MVPRFWSLLSILLTSNPLQSPALYGLQLLLCNAGDKPHLKNVFICEIQNFETHYYKVPLGHSANLFAISLLLCVSVLNLCLCLGHLLSCPLLPGLRSCYVFINFFIITTAHGLPSYSWNGILCRGLSTYWWTSLVYTTLLVYFLNITYSHIFFTVL